MAITLTGAVERDIRRFAVLRGVSEVALIEEMLEVWLRGSLAGIPKGEVKGAVPMSGHSHGILRATLERARWILPEGLRLRDRYKGKQYGGESLKGGRVRFEGQEYQGPGEAARLHRNGGQVNAWTSAIEYWSEGDKYWRRIDELRRNS